MENIFVSLDASNEAMVRTYPVCECGCVLYNLKFTGERTERSHGKITHISGGFSPFKCPNCGRKIVTIQNIDIKECLESRGEVNFNYDNYGV